MRRLTPSLFALAVLIVAATACSSPAPDEELSDRLDAMTPEDQLVYLRGLESQGRKDAVLYFHLGNAFFALEELDSAVVYYQHAVAADSSYSKAWVNMGLAHDNRNDQIESRKAFNAAIEVNPNDVLAHCHLGYSYFSRGQVSEAIRYYQMALEIDPKSPQAHYNLGLAFADAKVFREALIEWEQVIALDPDSELGKTAAENVELIRTYMELDAE